MASRAVICSKIGIAICTHVILPLLGALGRIAMSEPPLEELYDPATLRVIDGWSREQPAVEPTRPWRRAAVAGAIKTALVTGVREALEDEEEDAVVDIDRVRERSLLEPVTLYFVPGEPRASVAIVRPWLL